jgi:putative transposase
MRTGFMFLVAILDWHSRYVLSFGLLNTLDTVFCVEALKEALISGRPRDLQYDQGCQFTSVPFTGVLEAHEVRISMDGRGCEHHLPGTVSLRRSFAMAGRVI